MRHSVECFFEVQVDGIDVGSLLPVDLHVDEQLVHAGSDGVVLEGLVGHDVAPVARRVAHRQQDRSIERTGRLEGRLAPRVPVDRVVGVLAEVGAGRGGETVVEHLVGDAEVIDEVLDGAIERLGGLDVLVNNAAANPYAGPTIDVDLPRWEKTFQVNVTAPMFWTQAAWRKRMSEHGGVVVNISSVGGLSTSPILGVYDVTKAALIHLTKQLAAEMGPKVRVNAIAPGLIKTDFARVLWEGERGDEVAQAYPLGRLGEVEDIAAAALYLAADTGSWMTGQTMVLDGGGLVAFTQGG